MMCCWRSNEAGGVLLLQAGTAARAGGGDLPEGRHGADSSVHPQRVATVCSGCGSDTRSSAQTVGGLEGGAGPGTGGGGEVVGIIGGEGGNQGHDGVRDVERVLARLVAGPSGW